MQQTLAPGIAGRALLLALLPLLMASCGPGAETKLPESQARRETKPAGLTGIWKLKEVSSASFVFSNGQKVTTGLHETEFIGQVPVAGQAPYLLYSGRYCGNCDARRMLYLSQPAEMPIETDSGKNRLMHPGVMTDLETGEVLYKARAFYGTVLPNTNGMIWYQESLSDYNSLIPNIFLIKIDQTGRRDTAMAYKEELWQQTQELLKKGACVEIKGLEYQSEP